MGYGVALARMSYSSRERAAALVEVTRPLLSMMGPPVAGAGAVLALNGFPSLSKCFWGSLVVLVAAFGMHTFNDWRDKRRDLRAWPGRPIPSGRLKSPEALALSLFFFALSLLGAWRLFNPTLLAVLVIALALGVIYCLVLRDRVGYLSLPPIVGLFPIGGWAAFSPDTLFTSPLPWLLYLLTVGWQAGHIMVYSAGHPVEEIGGRMKTEVPALLLRPSPRGASILGLAFLVATLVVSIGLYLTSPLRYLYLVIAVGSGLVVVAAALRLVGDPLNRRKALLAFNVASFYEMALFGGILLDVFVFRLLVKYGRIALSYLSSRPDLIPVAVAVALSLIAVALSGAVLVGLGARLLRDLLRNYRLEGIATD